MALDQVEVMKHFGFDRFPVDQADLNKKIACPLLALLGERGPTGRLYDVLSTWKERATKVTGKALPSGHNLQEEVPDLVVNELQAFLRS
jgi:haloacetate dehalogenase